MKDILLLGAGKIGTAIAELLAATGDYRLCVASRHQSSLDRLPAHDNVTTLALDVGDDEGLRSALQGKFAVLNACPFGANERIARAARAAGVHYLDLTEDTATAGSIRSLAVDASSVFIPQCGLAPGFISILTHELTRPFETLRDVHMRVGALPQFPSNALKYNLTWSTAGLINEYCNPCEAIVEGKRIEVQPLEGVEEFSIDGITYEAFNTSGGLGTLCETLAGKVTNLNYRSVRYPGHRDVMNLLLHDLRLRERRELLQDILEAAIPVTHQDVVLIFVSVSGLKDGQLLEVTHANKIYSREINGKSWAAIQVTTAAGICAVLDLLTQGKLPTQGVVRQEQIPYAEFIGNRFGKVFAIEGGP